MHDPLQIVFDGAEAAQDALEHMAGVETALARTLAPILGRDEDTRMVWALVESIGHFRQTAVAEVRRMQAASIG